MQINKLLSDSSNYTKGRTKNIKYIVIHYTANNGDLAKSNCNYFQTANRGASAHYFVDEKEVWQSVEDSDTAWHCGTSGQYYHSECRNNNAIGVELCSEKDSKGNYYFNDETIENAVNLVKMLMSKYNIPIQNIVRHYDVTHKICPAPFVNNNTAWENFKNKLEEEEYMFVERNYSYNGKTKCFNVINEREENYIRIRDLAELLNKNIKYDNNTKITSLDDVISTVSVMVNDKEHNIQTINSNGYNYMNARELADALGFDTAFNEEVKKVDFKLKNNEEFK